MGNIAYFNMFLANLYTFTSIRWMDHQHFEVDMAAVIFLFFLGVKLLNFAKYVKSKN